MKKRILKLILLIVPAMLLFSCSKDNFSEKDALEAQQTIDLSITVVDGSSSLEPVQGATVKLLVDSSFVSMTTNSAGTVVFTKVKIGGDATVTVSKDQFTTVLKTVYTGPDSYRQTQVSDVVSIFSLAAGKTATLKGRLTLQSDVTDRDREPAVGVEVKARNYNLSATDQMFTSITDANGDYTITIPVSSNGDQVQLYYPDFTVNQKLAQVQNDNSVSVSTRPVLFKSSSGPTFSIPAIPSIYATIATPPVATGAGFALSSKANRTPLSWYSDYLLIDGGAGYNNGVAINNYQLSFSPDPNGRSATLYVDIAGGKITRINFLADNGASYATAPTLNTNVLSATTPATIAFAFQTTYKIYISNKGTNYLSYPMVSVETESYSYTGIKVKSVDPNVNDGSSSILGTSYLLSNYSVIFNGLIKSAQNGDTLITNTAAFSSAPVFRVAANTTRKAALAVYTNSINSDSTLASISIADAGLGYNPTTPPVVTLTTLAGYGTGALAKATVSTSGAISNIFIIEPGQKYVRNVNDYKKSGVTGSSYDAPSYPQTNYYGVKPGETVVQDVYYGTGYQIINQTTGK